MHLHTIDQSREVIKIFEPPSLSDSFGQINSDRIVTIDGPWEGERIGGQTPHTDRARARGWMWVKHSGG